MAPGWPQIHKIRCNARQSTLCPHLFTVAIGIEVRLLPAQYIRAYVKRNKTDAADAAALLEAARASDMQPVRIKSVE